MCDNPWVEKPCTKHDIALSIMFKENQKDICHSCWKKIAEEDIEWGEDPKPESITQILNEEREKYEKTAKLMEYKGKGIKQVEQQLPKYKRNPYKSSQKSS